MLNSEPGGTGPTEIGRPDINGSDASGPARSPAAGAVALAGLATFIVVAIWFAFYLLVFVPRAGAP